MGVRQAERRRSKPWGAGCTVDVAAGAPLVGDAEAVASSSSSPCPALPASFKADDWSAAALLVSASSSAADSFVSVLMEQWMYNCAGDLPVAESRSDVWRGTVGGRSAPE